MIISRNDRNDGTEPVPEVYRGLSLEKMDTTGLIEIVKIRGGSHVQIEERFPGLRRSLKCVPLIPPQHIYLFKTWNAQRN